MHFVINTICVGAHFLELNAFQKRGQKIPSTPHLTYESAGRAWSIVGSTSLAWAIGDSLSKHTSSRILIVGTSAILFAGRVISSYQIWTENPFKDPSSSKLGHVCHYLLHGIDYLVQLIPNTPSYLKDIWK